MTYVAAQKGWDGLAMTILILFAWLFAWQFNNTALARRWLELAGVVVKARSFQFGGRTQMIGAVQVFSGSEVTGWMDGILAPCARREAWLERLRPSSESVRTNGNGLSDYDRDWVALQTELAIQAAEVMRGKWARVERV